MTALEQHSRSDIPVLLIGPGGYGYSYFLELLEKGEEIGARLAGVVMPEGYRFDGMAALEKLGVPVCPDIDSFYRAHSASLAVIAAPPHFHADMIRIALANGSSVLCEKPLCSTIQEARAIAEFEAASSGFVAVGYQRCFSSAVKQLKADIAAGKFGKAKIMKTMACWPRAHSYYRRNNWAGVVKMPDGAWVLDSPAHNATAHFLHNALYLAGGTPVEVQAELYRSNSIQNFDTAAIRCRTDAGSELLFYTTHTAGGDETTAVAYEFENAVVRCDPPAAEEVIAHFPDGTTKHYGNQGEGHMNKLHDSLDAVGNGTRPACCVETAIPEVLCINGAQESMPEITEFPEELLRETETEAGPMTWVPGLREQFTECYEWGILPSEHGSIPWARAGKVIDLRDYKSFPLTADILLT